jgi:hypothetical protein
MANIHFDEFPEDPDRGCLQFIMELSERAPHLEYLAVYNFPDESFYGKRVRGEWVLCDKEAFIDF